MPLPPLGVNLWQFHKTCDALAAASAAAASGYATVETVGAIQDPAALRQRLDAIGIDCAARHIVLAELGDLDGLTRSTQAIGAAHLVSSGLQVWDERKVGDYRHAGQVLDRAGRILRERGLRLHYHHHEFEFLPVSAMTGIELLLEHRDPEAWDLCVDVGWAKVSGCDPLDFLRRHRGCVSYVHLRDYTQAGTSCALGQGTMDLAGIIAEIAANPRMRMAMVEQEPSSDPAADAASSLAYLRTLGEWRR
jgi:sugar phosphate isomerase/epimerase